MEVEKNVCQRLVDQDSSRPDLPQATHRLVEEGTLGGIFFLRLKTSHLRPNNRLLNRRYYALL
jgi:hypothetical protein